jgi:IS4 transposase
MVLDPLMERFAREAPACVMVRTLMEAAIEPGELDRRLEAVSAGQYTRELLFSTLVDLMSLTVTRTQRSMHAAMRACAERIPVSTQAVYGKLARTEPAVSRELVVFVREKLQTIRQQLGPTRPLVEGYQTLVVDGNHLTGTEHRLKVVRHTRAGALPGQALVAYQPDNGLIWDVWPYEDAHAQERRIMPQMIAAALPGQLYIADRNFCTTGSLLDLHARGAAFLIRRHGSSLCARTISPPRSAGRQDGRTLSEQALEIYEGNTGRTLVVRQVTIHRAQQNPKLDDIVLLTTLPRRFRARFIAQLYLERWTIERAFQDLTANLGCEIDTLCYPKAALLGFCVALVSYNLWAVCRAAIAQAQGLKPERQISTYYLADEWQGTYRGMMIALPPEHWARFQDMSAADLAAELLRLAGLLRPARYAKSPRGPKKPNTKKLSGKVDHHVSVARLLAARQNK